jgi:hypothetical protein
MTQRNVDPQKVMEMEVGESAGRSRSYVCGPRPLRCHKLFEQLSTLLLKNFFDDCAADTAAAAAAGSVDGSGAGSAGSVDGSGAGSGDGSGAVGVEKARARESCVVANPTAVAAHQKVEGKSHIPHTPFLSQFSLCHFDCDRLRDLLPQLDPHQHLGGDKYFVLIPSEFPSRGTVLKSLCSKRRDGSQEIGDMRLESRTVALPLSLQQRKRKRRRRSLSDKKSI